MLSHSIAQASVLIDAGTLAVGAVGIAVGFLGTIIVQRMQTKASDSRLEREDALRLTHWHREQKLSTYAEYLTSARLTASAISTAEAAAADQHYQAEELRGRAGVRLSALEELESQVEFLAPTNLSALMIDLQTQCRATLDALWDVEEDPGVEVPSTRELPGLVLRIHAAMQEELGLSTSSA
ncbi:hypothetical protein [Pseudoclavibacter sp. 8L]|uniref:hypothetical protein n=1 Tax=Pseudoclavibacter sp. 8L TaxID=2653162 RepID=UPI0012F2CD40|nr:hypothetical protein [Pseudoclavibacter sp. 8L]VXB29718.1 hypothetical protein PSCLAVI8L_130415 [Pseudoclavibacter sp. 8L]